MERESRVHRQVNLKESTSCSVLAKWSKCGLLTSKLFMFSDVEVCSDRCEVLARKDRSSSLEASVGGTS